MDTSTVKQTLQDLDSKIEELFRSEEYKRYLKMISKFHRYSYANILLILCQFPEATRVASYTTFKRIHRQVLKGSKGIKILCPCKYKALNKDGEEVYRLSYKFGTVFDVSQTVAIDERGEIPKLSHLLKNNSPVLRSVLGCVHERFPFVKYDSSLPTGTNGVFNRDDNTIRVRTDLSDEHELKTTIHELAHYVQWNCYEEKVSTMQRSDLEVAAESAAYTVFQLLADNYGLGIDSSEYSVGYVASWANGRKLKELKEVLDLVVNEVREVARMIEPCFEQILNKI